MIEAKNFFNLANFPFPDLFSPEEEVWNPLKKLKNFISDHLHPNLADLPLGVLSKTYIIYQGKLFDRGFHLDRSSGSSPRVIFENNLCPEASILYAGSIIMDPNIYIGQGTVVEPGALIMGPTIIGDFTEVRQGAYIRGHVLVGSRCVVGHTTEVKHSILLGDSKAGHFSYIGDSILGKVNLGAGTKLANLKVFSSSVTVTVEGKRYQTGLRKMGAILGDGVETGCNTVTAPGTIVSPNVLAYPNATLRGYYPPSVIVKVKQDQQLIERRDDK
ncbi:MAG: glucose-1-phosphate thymidylyltransferase [bacterium]|nr:glucose-1-phosphate thymidylyltransferase [bacterium]